MGAGSAASAVAMVVDSSAASRNNLLEALSGAGFRTRDLGADEARDESERSVLIITLRTDHDRQLLQRESRDCTELTTVALLVSATPQSYQAALRLGACAAAALDAPMKDIVQVVQWALEDHTLLPSEVARALATAAAPDSVAAFLADEEIEWLRLLARGVTVATLSRAAGYSERNMYRHLHRVYSRLKVSRRSDAVRLAVQMGLIDSF